MSLEGKPLQIFWLTRSFLLATVHMVPMLESEHGVDDVNSTLALR
jgi:hypothetical protein